LNVAILSPVEAQRTVVGDIAGGVVMRVSKIQTNDCSERLALKSRIKQLAIKSAPDELSEVAPRASSIGQIIRSSAGALARGAYLTRGGASTDCGLRPQRAE